MKDFWKGFIPLFISALIPCIFYLLLFKYEISKVIENRHEMYNKGRHYGT